MEFHYTNKFTSGYREFQKILDQLEKLKEDLPEGQEIKDGSNEEFDFFKDMFKKINEQVDPALETVVNNINKTNTGQIQYILNELKEQLKVEHWQALTKTGENREAKINAWNKLLKESIREIFYFIYTSQVFFS